MHMDGDVVRAGSVTRMPRLFVIGFENTPRSGRRRRGLWGTSRTRSDRVTRDEGYRANHVLMLNGVDMMTTGSS
jgi:hypothetical protein